MRQSTYLKLEQLYPKYNGYIGTRHLMGEGFTNRQIALLTEEHYLEKVCHGYYWMSHCGLSRPFDYKCIEVCLGHPRAVISLDSALYYQHVIQTEPAVLSVATARTDRSSIRMNFPVRRHYFSDHLFEPGQKTVQTAFGSYQIYDVERSLCDIIRLDYEDTESSSLVETCSRAEQNSERYHRFIRYAELLGVKVLP